MRDETRADVLFAALAGERQVPDDQEHDEVRVLADLGARLEGLGPAMAAMARAEDVFDPSFAAGLHRTLLAAHPATVQPEPMQAGSAARQAARAARRISRRMLTLVLLALALAATVVITILHGAQQTAPVGTGVLNSTATPVARSARSFAAKIPSPPMGGLGHATKTPGARTFSPMELRPSPRARPTASRAGSGAAPTQTATVPPTTGGVPVVTGAASNRTPTNGPARIATAPGPSTPTAIHGASGRFGGPIVGAPGIQSAEGGVVRYQLPKSMPNLPSTASVYRLRPAPISPAEIQAITASFSGLRPIQGTNGLEFTNPDERLQFAPTIGEILYTNLHYGTGASTPAADPSAIAHDWLRAHRLLPTHVGSLTTTVTPNTGWITVNIVPTLLDPAILSTAQIPAITVVVDHQGVVTNARIRWATAEPAGITALISPSAATRAEEKAGTAAAEARSGPTRAQAGSLFIVTSVTLAYQPIIDGKTLALRPVYRFRGTLEGRPLSQTVAAVAR